MSTTFRVLPKNHFYERQTRTLFASDTWGLVPQAQTGPMDVIRADVPSLSTAAILRYFRHRFEWLAGTDTTPMQDELLQLGVITPD